MKRVLVILLILSALAGLVRLGAAGQADAWRIESFTGTLTVGTPGPDVAPLFQAQWNQGRPFDPAELAPYRIVFVPGLFGDYIRPFYREIASLEANGIAWTMAAIDSEQTPAANAPAIRAAILGSPQPVVLVSHSKGGVDILEVLLAQPDLQRRVRAWIAIQSPFFGSPAADAVLNSWEAGPARRIFDLSNGSIDGLVSLQPAIREAFIRQRLADIRELTARVTVVSVATWSLFADMAPLPRAMQLMYGGVFGGRLTDGMAALDSQLLPGSYHLVISGIDHVESSIVLTEAVLRLAVATIPQAYGTPD